MEDLLYFSKQQVRLRDLAQLADELGYRHEYVAVAADGEEWLNIYYQDESDVERFWQWIPLRIDKEDLGWEPAERAIIEAYAPAASYVVAHHPPFRPRLSGYLQRLLGRHGGWISAGTEAGSWEPTATAETLATFPYPYDVRDGPAS